MRYKGGYNTYGITIGVMVTNKIHPRTPGSVGNATTFDFPVRFRVVRESTGDRHRRGDLALLEPFIAAAKELDAEGVKAITTSCGLLGVFQKELAGEVNALVLTSSLLQVPLVYRMLRPDQRIGVLTADAPNFSVKLLESVGAANVPVVVRGLETQEEFRTGILEDKGTVDFDKVAQEIVNVAQDMVGANPDIGAVVLECCAFPSFAKFIQDATGLPVFDIVTLTKWVHSALVQREYSGHM